MPFEAIGTAIGQAFGGFGEKPKAPKYEEIKPEEIQAKTVAGNIAVTPEAGRLAGMVNVFNQEQLEKMTRSALGSSLFDAVRQNIERLTKGEFTAGEQKAIQSTLSARSFGLGVPGSGFATGLEAFGLSRESLARTQAGLSSAAAWLGLTRAPVMDISASFFSPQQRLAAAFQEREFKTGLEWLRNQLAAAPDPGDAAMAQAWVNQGRKMDSALLSMSGMMAGGMGGAGAGASAGAGMGSGGGALGGWGSGWGTGWGR